jgi:uncharacterized membrane protein HdeD (DUF308 family)
VITSQEIPVGGYPQPQVGFLTLWGLDLLFTSFFTISGIIFLVTNRKKARFLMLIPGFIGIVAGIVLCNNELMKSYMLPLFGILILAVGIYFIIRQPNSKMLVR